MKTSELLKKYGIKLKKSLGQSFLSTQSVAERIVKAAEIKKGETVIEIGAGAGTLTEELLKAGANVVAYEIDRNLEKLLIDRLSKYENVTLIFKDFLSADLSFLPDGFVYVANIPYYITGPIIEKILRENRFSRAILMVQKEVANRITSPPGRRDFGYLSALVQTFCDVKKLFDVSRSSFVPNPEVDSTVLGFKPKEIDIPFDEYREFLSKVFMKKRKTIKNNLKGIVKDPEKVLKDLGIDPSLRPEQLGTSQLIKLFRHLQVS